MSASYIESALNARLIAASPGAAVMSSKVDWQKGIVFKPTSGVAWYRVAYMPGKPVAAAVGEDAANRHVGAYQVDVFYPTGSTLGKAEAQRICGCYPRGLALTYSGVTVRIEASYVAKQSIEPDFVQWPVLIYWRADVAN